MSSLCVQLAQSNEEFAEALNLIYSASRVPNSEDLSGLGLLKQHALPSSNVVVAKLGGRVVGALTLFGDNPFHLPLEERHTLDRIRNDLDGRFAEISAVGIAPDCKGHTEIFPALFYYAFCFGATYCHYDAFVTELRESEADYAAKLGFRKLSGGENTTAFWLESRLAPDLRKQLPSDAEVEYRFPPQKFFLVAHQNMSAEVMNHLFNERSKVFARMSDAELRVLKSIYDCGEFAKILPERALRLPFERFPRFRRFPMNCDGYLCNKKGERVHLLVLDVSREGLKVKAEEPLQNGKVYALTVSVGVTKQSEIIATTVWVDKQSNIAGLTLQSRDGNWDNLIEYLESDFLKTAS